MAPEHEPDSEATISLIEAAERLGVHYMTAYRYVRTGRLAGTKSGSEWRIDPADIERLRQPPTSKPARGSRRLRYPEHLEDRFIQGDEAGAWSVIEGAMAAGMTPSEVYSDLISPVMASIGERWAANELTVDQEHVSANIVLRCIGRLGPRFARRGRRRGTVVLGAPAGDAHSIPLHLAADLLRGEGFDVLDLGANVPAPSFGQALRRVDRLICMGVCATLPDNETNIAEALTAIRAATDVPVVLGGLAVATVDQALALGADAYSSTTQELLDFVEMTTSSTTA